MLGGAGIRRGTIDVPSGIVDIAPTVLALLELPALPDADGRVLAEALEGGPAPELGRRPLGNARARPRRRQPAAELGRVDRVPRHQPGLGSTAGDVAWRASHASAPSHPQPSIGIVVHEQVTDAGVSVIGWILLGASVVLLTITFFDRTLRRTPAA